LLLLAVGVFFAAGTSGPAGAMVVNLTAESIRATASGTRTPATNLLGLAAGPFVVGLLADRLGLVTAMWFIPLAAAAVLSVGRLAYPVSLATGFAICGASAIAAMEETAVADEEDIAVGVAMVTPFGTVATVLLPLPWHPSGLSDAQFGVWADAGNQEVGQVVAAAGAGGRDVADPLKPSTSVG
jgi:uncharacterized membrane protein YadS